MGSSATAKPDARPVAADVFCDLLAGISPASGPILRAGAVELLVPLATLTGEADAPATLAGYGPVTADVARQIATAYAEVSRHTDDGLAATARTANETVAPQPPVQWRFRVHDDGTLLFHGTTGARPTGHAGPAPARADANVDVDGNGTATATASARVSRARRRTRAYCAQRSPRIAR